MAKSVKSLRLRKKSSIKTSTDDPNFWPRFNPELVATEFLNVPEKFSDTNHFPDFPLNSTPTQRLSSSAQFEINDETLQTFYLSNVNAHKFFVEHFGAIDLLWHREWNRTDFEPLTNVFQWNPLNHLYSGSDVAKYNSNGKYLVRIFLNDAWRMVSVDDEGMSDDHAWASVLLKAIWKVNFPKVQKAVEAEEVVVPDTCNCKEDYQRKTLPALRDYLDPIQMMTGWKAVKHSLSLRPKCEKWGVIGVVMNKEGLVVLEVEIDSTRRFYEVLDIRFYPQIQFEHKWKTYRWKDWAIQNNLYRCESDCNGILIRLPSVRLSEVNEFIDEGNYVGEKSSVPEDVPLPNGKPSKQRVSFMKILRPQTVKVWLDFEKISSYLKSITAYLKPTYVNNFVLSNEEGAANCIIIKPMSEFYVVTEAETDEELVVSLSSMRNGQSRKNATIYAYNFDWKGFDNEDFFIMNTLTSCTKTYQLPPGRRIYRMEVVSDYFTLGIQSNSDLKICLTFLDVMKVMETWPMSVVKFNDRLLDSFLNLLNSLQGTNFIDELRNFYKTVQEPFTAELRESKRTREFIWEKFFKTLLTLMPSESSLLKSLFLSPGISRRACCYVYHTKIANEMVSVYNQLKFTKCPCERATQMFDDCYVDQVRDYAATLIQTHFKRILVQRTLQARVKNEFFTEAKTLHDKFQAIIPDLVHQYVPATGLEFSVFYDDWKSFAMSQQFTGNADGLLFSFPIWVYSKKAIPCLFHLNAKAPLKLINEDTQEIQEVDPNTAIFLRETSSGYTIFAYTEQTDWELFVVTEDTQQIAVDSREINRFQHSSVYRKYYDNKICRFFMEPTTSHIFIIFEISTTLDLQLQICHPAGYQYSEYSKTGKFHCMPVKWPVIIEEDEWTCSVSKLSMNSTTRELSTSWNFASAISSEETSRESEVHHQIPEKEGEIMIEVQMIDEWKAPESFEWNMKIYSEDSECSYDDEKDQEDAELRRTWEEMGCLEKGRQMRLQYPQKPEQSSGSSFPFMMFSSSTPASSKMSV